MDPAKQAVLLILELGWILAVLFFLWLLFLREQVKKELSRRGLVPIRVRWRPFAYWAGPYGSGFWVVYGGPLMGAERGRCWVSNLDFRVRWIDPESGYLPSGLPMVGKWVYALISAALCWFGAKCLLAQELILPGTLRHPGPVRLRGWPLILLGGAALSGAVNCLIVVSHNVLGSRHERLHTVLARSAGAIGWAFLLASLVVYTVGGMRGVGH